MEDIQLGVENTSNNKKKAWIGIAIFAVIIIIAIAIGVTVAQGEGTYLTYNNYIKIQDGMSYSQVVDILDGHQGVLDSSSGFGDYTLKYYTWTNGTGSKCIVVGFENGKVCAKTQYGLR